MERRPPDDPKPLDMDSDAGAPLERPGPSQVYAPSEYPESVASGSVSIIGDDQEERQGTGQVYAPSQFAESVASRSEQGDLPLSGACGSEDVDVRIGSLGIYTPSNCAESVASRSEQGETPSEDFDRSQDTDASSERGEVYIPSQYAESVFSGQSGTISSTTALSESLEVSVSKRQEARSGASEISGRTALAGGELAKNASTSEKRERKAESLISMRKSADVAKATLPRSLSNINFKYELVDTSPTEARAFNIRFDKLYTISHTVLLTECDPGSPHCPQDSIQFELREHTSFSRIRFAAFHFRQTITVVVGDGQLFLFDEDGREIWSDQTGLHVEDISADLFIEGKVHVLTSTEYRIYQLENDALKLMDTVVPLPRVDSGKTYLFGNSIYITREKAGRVLKVDTNTCRITEVIKGLVRPITALAIGWIENSPEQRVVALSDERNVHVYLKDTLDLVFTIPVGSDIIDIELIIGKIFVLTKNDMKVYRLSRR